MRRSKDHLYDLLGQTVHVIVDRPIGHRHKGMVYPVNYGYVPGLTGGDGDSQDAYILGVDQPLEAFDGQVIGVIRRHDDVEDKLVVAPAGTRMHQGQIMEAVQFQEQFFQTSVDCLMRKSCGVIPYRLAGADKEYLIVYEQFSQAWSLPKGHMEPGETEIQTALRELREETGLTAQLEETKRVVTSYPVGPRSRKEVIFFPGKVQGEVSVRPGEIETFRWVKAEELQNFLFPDTYALIRSAL